MDVWLMFSFSLSHTNTHTDIYTVKQWELWEPPKGEVVAAAASEALVTSCVGQTDQH